MKFLNVLMVLALAVFVSCSKSKDAIDMDDSDEIEMVDGEEGEWSDDVDDVDVADSDDEDFGDDDFSEDDEDMDLAEEDGEDFGDDDFSEDDDELELAEDDDEDFGDDFSDDEDGDLELAEDDTLEEDDLLADGGDDFSIDEDEVADDSMVEDTSIASVDTETSIDTSGGDYSDDSFVEAAPTMPVDDMSSSYASAAPASYESTPVPSGETGSYTVQANETLMIIAFKLYGDYTRWKEIAALNAGKLGGGTNISNGMTLEYSTSGAGFSFNPAGSPYLIQRGDTLGTISSRTYGTSAKWRSIWDNNRPLIKDPNKIFAGFTIYLPEDGVRNMASAATYDSAPSESIVEQTETIEESIEQASEEIADDLDADNLDDFPEEI